VRLAAASGRYWTPFRAVSNRETGMIWEQRWHPLRGEWVIVSSHRGERPWQGERVGRGGGGAAPGALPPYVQDCYLCPGNLRSSGVRNDRYTGVFVFDNDHPCVGPEAPPSSPRRRESIATRRPWDAPASSASRR